MCTFLCRFDGDFPYTGHNSPLYALPEEDADPDSYGYHFNTNYSVNYWIEKGADPEKVCSQPY